MFVTRLRRLGGEYFVTVPHDVVAQRDLHEGQVISIVIESLAAYATVDGEPTDPADAGWKLNEERSPYSESE